MAELTRPFTGHQTLLRMFPIVHPETFVEFVAYLYRVIGPIQYFRIMEEIERPNTVVFIKFYNNHHHIDLFDFVYASPDIENEWHRLQVRVNAVRSRIEMNVDFQNMFVYVRSRDSRNLVPLWSQLVSKEEIDRLNGFNVDDTIGIPALPLINVDDEVDYSDIDSLFKETVERDLVNVQASPRVTPKRRENCVINQFQ
ncbi:unnamed protein product [Brachionus calyciflorus]|uniref:Uncharacterized protein n=1 Tax=Brachionus calyciflorus TaxID=104777 RepID=A0A814NV64_9BILA|nr:unnamed protein product [Brachionus calyciflorus]